MEKKNNPDFPSYQAIRRLGEAKERLEKLRAFVLEKAEFGQVLRLLPEPSKVLVKTSCSKRSSGTEEGFVYLGVLKIGSQKRYKIGRTNLVSRRSTELTLQLPEKMELVHYIKTDDMIGVERYWHSRFSQKIPMVNGSTCP